MFKIGYLPLSKVNWTNDTLEAARANAIAFLKTLPNVEVIAPDHMLALEGEAIEVLDQWEKDRPDLIVAHFLTFSLGVVPPMFAQRLKVPILLWSQPEPDPKGGRLQNNSFCAANMNAHHMWRLGIPYFYVHAQAGTKEAEAQLMKQIRVAQAMKALGRMRIGLIGGRVPGFLGAALARERPRRDPRHRKRGGGANKRATAHVPLHGVPSPPCGCPRRPRNGFAADRVVSRHSARTTRLHNFYMGEYPPEQKARGSLKAL